MTARKNRAVEDQVDWIPIRSRKHPAFWAPLLLTVLIATFLFVWAYDHTDNLLVSVNSKGLSDDEIIKVLILEIRTIVWTFGALLIVISVILYKCFSLGVTESRFPPSGLWSLGSWRAIVGPRVKKLALVGYALSLSLFLMGFGLISSAEYFLLRG